MSWLSKFTGVHISPKKSYVDRGQLGGLLKTVSPLAGAFIPGLGGLLTAGLGSALGEGVRPGGNFGSIVGAGAKGAGLAQVGHSLGTAQKGKSFLQNVKGAPRNVGNTLKGAFGGGGGGTAAGQVATAPDVASGLEDLSGAPARSAFVPSSVAPAAGKLATASKIGSSFKDYAPVAAAGLNYAGGASGRAAEERMSKAQAQQIEDENQRKREHEQMLDPLRQMIAQMFQQRQQQMGSYMPSSVTANPFGASMMPGGQQYATNRSGYFVPAG